MAYTQTDPSDAPSAKVCGCEEEGQGASQEISGTSEADVRSLKECVYLGEDGVQL